MNIRIGKSALAAIILAILSVAAYWYWSPFLTIREMQTAAQEKDADTFNNHVDYPRLRESVKGQLSALMAEEMASRKGSDNPFEALGNMLGMAMVDKLVDAMVRPEVVMRGMANGKFAPAAASDAESPGPSDSRPPTGEKAKWAFVRKGVDKLIAFPEGAAGAEDEKMGVVFERSGFASWKVTELRMPSLKSKTGN